MASSFYDDSRLRAMFSELDPKARRKTLKGAMRRTAGTVVKAARGFLSDEIDADRDVLKGIRGVVYKKTLGFRVTVGTKKAAKSDRRTAQQKRKGIVPLWMQGTDDRWRGSRSKFAKAARRISGTRKGYTGSLSHRTFMERTRDSELPKAERTMKEMIISSIEKTARKYGCTVQ